MIMQREEVIDVSDIRGLCDGGMRFSTQFIGGATVGAKIDALCFSSKLPQKRHPESR
jgi:hypothetical protein